LETAGNAREPEPATPLAMPPPREPDWACTSLEDENATVSVITNAKVATIFVKDTRLLLLVILNSEWHFAGI